MTHPLIMVYGDTFQHKFSLILFVGREPNDTKGVGGSVGLYNFDGSAKKRRCAFWNMAYKVVGDSLDPPLRVRQLKDESKARRSSVVAFADVSPRSLAFARVMKKRQREEVTEEEFEDHLTKISSNPLTTRIACAILSGSIDDGLASPRELLKEKLLRAGIESFDVPFLSGNTYPEIVARLNDRPEVRQKIADVAKGWMQAVQPHLH